MWIIIGIALWVICGVLSYGITFAFYQKQFPTIAKEHYDAHKSFATKMAMFGPINLLAALIVYGGYKHGFKWK